MQNREGQAIEWQGQVVVLRHQEYPVEDLAALAVMAALQADSVALRHHV